MERQIFTYNGEKFEEGELVLVNGKELMYCRYVDNWINGDIMFVAHVPRCKTIYRYEPKGDNYLIFPIIKSAINGDKIEHVYNPDLYNKNVPLIKEDPIINGYLIDGWIICIILMVATLIFKPVGAWSLLVLSVWLTLRHEEIKRIKSMKNKR